MSNIPIEPWATRRDEPPPQAEPSPEGVWATTREESIWDTRREQPGYSDDEATVRLPARLADRFTMVRQFPDPGAEADVVLARSHNGDEVVVKLYRLGVHADPDVWQRLGALNSTHIVRILETGQAAGRDYECMEYLPGGNLLTLVADGTTVPTHTIHQVIEQVTHALDALHGAGIVHCDLKPENILIRSGGPTDPHHPLDLVLTDFGLSRAPEQSVVAASRSGTLAYLAPELMLRSGAQSSKARDYWALGVVIRELLTAERPFQNMTERGVEWSVLMSGLDLSTIDEPRLRLLCQGLLTRNPDNRWGAEQLHSWLNGHNPAVIADEAPPADHNGIKPLSFAGERHTDRASLARVFLTNWDDATRRYLVGLSRGDNSSQAWRALRAWLEQFDDPDATDADSLITLIDDRLLADLPPDIKMLHLVRWLDPSQPPIYRGRSLDRDSLTEIARRAADKTDKEHTDAVRIVRDLWAHQLLTWLGGDLPNIDQEWRSLVGDARARVPHLLNVVPEPRPELDQVWASSVLLLSIVAPRTDSPTRGARTSAVSGVPGPVSWFDELQQQATNGLLDDLAVITAAPKAASEAQAAIEATRRAEAEKRGRQEAWERAEEDRLAGKGTAHSRATRYLIWIAVAFSVTFLLSVTFSPNNTLTTLTALLGFAVFGSIAWTEYSFAGEAAGSYPQFAPFNRGAGPLARLRGRGIGGGCLTLIVGYFALSFAVAAPSVVYLVVAGVHLNSFTKRRSAFRQTQSSERARALGGTA